MLVILVADFVLFLAFIHCLLLDIFVQNQMPVREKFKLLSLTLALRFNSLLYNTKGQKLADYKEFKMPYVVLCANYINLVMSHPSCTNYTGSLFITVYCLTIISLLIKQYISANLHICPL